MKFRKNFFLIICIAGFHICFGQSSDQRDVLNGDIIYSNSYIDQPYVVVLHDGRWLCVFTTGAESESRPGQHIVATMSKDQGKHWSKPISIEPNTGPMASWATPYLTSYGRIYVFYNYNGDNVSELNGKPIWQAGLLGWYCYKYSDDNGRTWSKKRYRLPVRKTVVDYNNDFHGKVQLFWGIDKPNLVGGSLYFAFTKLGKFPQGQGEGWLFKSDNIDTEKNPNKIHWQMLPEGNKGIRNPELGSVQEEFNMVGLNDGGLYCMFRTALGFPANTYSNDEGKTWTLPKAATYAPDGIQTIKNPRACPRVFKCSNGKYLLWFHNNRSEGWKGRNPVWLSGGIEKDGKIYWSQPEILLYTNNLNVTGMSYPDLIEQDGQYWVTETQKSVARVHSIDPDLLEGMWNQASANSVIKEGLILNKSDIKTDEKFDLKSLPNLKEGGFSIGMWIKFKDLQPGQIVLDSRDGSGKGLLITTTDRQSLRLQMSDGKREVSWSSDPGLLTKDKLHHIVFTVDGGPNIIIVLVDGTLCDGGQDRRFGWGRFSLYMTDINGDDSLTVAENLQGQIKTLRIYNRYLTTSEAISNFNAGFINNN